MQRSANPPTAVQIAPLTGVRAVGLILLVLTAMSSSDVLAQNFPTEPKVEAYVDGEGAVRIAWYVPELDETHAGFELSRAEVIAGTDEKDWKWSPIGGALIRPDFRLDRLKRLKLDKVIKQRPQMKKEFVDLPPDEAIAMILELPKKEFQKMQLAGAFEMQFAIAFGTGWIDREAERGKTYAYRVHIKHHGDAGKLKTEQLIGQQQLTYEINAIKMPRLESFEVVRSNRKGTVYVRWSIKAEELEGRQDLSIFTAIAGDPADPIDNSFQPAKHPARKSEDGKLFHYELWFKISEEDNKQDIPFVIEPGGRGGAKGPPTDPFVLPKLGGSLGNVKVKAEVDGDDVIVTWEHDAPDVGSFAGFEIKRWAIDAPGDPAAEVLSAELLPAGDRKFVDKGAARKYPNQRVQYYVRAKASDWRSDSRGVQATLKMPKLALQAKPELKAKPVLKDGKPHVEVEVICKDVSDISSFGVYKMDPNDKRWRHLGSVDPKTMKATLEPNWTRPGKTGFRVIAYSKTKKESAPSKAVYAEMPWDKPPVRVKRMLFKVYEDRVEFDWEVHKTEYGLKGARILADGKVLVDETKIDAKARSYVWRGKVKKLHEYSIVYVDDFDRTGEPQKGLLNNRPPAFPEDKNEVGNKKPKIVKTFVRRFY